MADILGNIDVEHWKSLWHEINKKQQDVDFYRKNLIVKYNWDDVYDIIAYERSIGAEPFISAMTCVNLVKGKLKKSYLMGGDVFIGEMNDRMQDVYSELNLMFLRKIPDWDMSYGVYLDTYLVRDIDTCVRKTANFFVYGTGRGTDGPGAALSLSGMTDKDGFMNGERDKTGEYCYLGRETGKNILAGNVDGEDFEPAEKNADGNAGVYAAGQSAGIKEITPELLNAIAFTHKFKVRLSPKVQTAARHAMMTYMSTEAKAEHAV